LDTASSSWKAGTTAPAGSTSILRRPPAMSLTFLAKSLAYSWKMSLAGQVDWKRSVVVCAVATMGTAMAPVATAAPLSTPRRDVTVFFSDIGLSPVRGRLEQGSSFRVHAYQDRVFTER
jgi:hypothetical protein